MFVPGRIGKNSAMNRHFTSERAKHKGQNFGTPKFWPLVLFPPHEPREKR
jgi:hypothetical protein